jgi:hypothetical protein
MNALTPGDRGGSTPPATRLVREEAEASREGVRRTRHTDS